MSTALTVNPKAEAIERVVIQGDLARLNPEERVNYYRLVCESVGLNPLTKPFEYITLNGKLTLYARKDATDQLRNIHQVSVRIVGREVVEGCYVVTAQASFPSGRVDESIGAVPIENLKGENRANAMMKCETKAKRRVTLSACGLGMLDEMEIETIPSARQDIQRTTAPIPISRNPAMVAAPEGGTSKGQANPEKVADKPQEGGVSAGAPTPPMRERQPGEDDEPPDALIDALEKSITLKTIADDPGMIANFAKSFREALPKHLQKQPIQDELRHKWLAEQFFMDKNGNPSSESIPKQEFNKWKAQACKWAASQ
jgi:hypothetical protein